MTVNYKYLICLLKTGKMEWHMFEYYSVDFPGETVKFFATESIHKLCDYLLSRDYILGESSIRKIKEHEARGVNVERYKELEVYGLDSNGVFRIGQRKKTESESELTRV